MSRKKWRIAAFDKKTAADIAYEYSLDELAVLILNSRGITEPDEIAGFLTLDEELSDPYLIKDMDKAVNAVRDAIDAGDRITVYGDYDADGVTATSLLYTYLLTVGADADYYIPSRVEEGYGLNNGAADRLAESGTKLIVTVDNGISSVAEAEYIRSKGMKLVITDHHQPGSVLPNAEAVVDPHRSDYTSPCKELAGVGVAFKLISALEDGDYENVFDDFADMAAIGTIADIVPLKGENRLLVSRGLDIINSSQRAGILALKKIAGYEDKNFSSSSVAFSVAPRINAAGRVGSADIAVKLLTSDDYDEALEFARRLDECNAERQSIEAAIVDAAIEKIESDPSYRTDRVIVVDGEDWHAGVIGIVASRLVDKYSKPAMVIARSEGKAAKGSCRSVEGFALFDALTYLSSYLVQFGGHTLAAGFSIEQDRIADFRKAVNEYAAGLGEFTPVMNIDCKLNPAGVGTKLLDSLSLLEPFGAENVQPVFCMSNMTVKSVKAVGNAGKHIKIQLERDKTSLWSVYFGMSAERFPYRTGERIDVAAVIDKNEFRGEVKPNVNIRAVRPAGCNDDELFASLSLYRRIRYAEEISEADRREACPDRELAARVFRSVRVVPLYEGDEEVIIPRISAQWHDICRIKVILDAFREVGLLTVTDGIYTPSQTKNKVSLTSSRLLTKLGYSE